jgi:hypothetical protein
MRTASLLALILAGCGSNTVDAGADLARAGDGAQGVDLAAAPDLAGVDLAGADLAEPPDLAMPPGPDLASVDLSGPPPGGSVECGAQSCSGATPICCRPMPYGAGTCIAPGGACASLEFPCDDRSDCPPGEICCNVLGSGSACTTAAACTAMMGREMCHVATDCPVGEMCCGFGAGPNYYCGNTCPISRRDAKRDIEYVDGKGRSALASEILRYKLATYRYRTDGEEGPLHLGFLIDDVEPSLSIAPGGDSVDLYGYASMAVAALQEQEQRIEKLERELAELKRERTPRRGPAARK